ncbi:MAG: hypothetical protein OHK0039_32070 [Bacteroidia bacterium]
MVVLLGGCALLDRPEPLPVYAQLASVRIAYDSAASRTTRTGVKDLWIDHNGALLGTYRIGATIPVLPTPGNNRLTLAGGIFETGLSSVRARYPFWQPVTIDFDLSALDTLVLNPTFYYYPDTVLAFPFDEDFESASVGLTSLSSGDNRTLLSPSTLDAFHGSRSGRVAFDSRSYLFEAIGTSYFRLPQSGNNDVYLEISYRGDIAFTAGLYYVGIDGFTVGEIPAGLNFKSDTWNTVYIHVNDQVRGLPAQTLFRPYIRATSLDNSTGVAASGVLYVDNIRIVHFQ